MVVDGPSEPASRLEKKLSNDKADQRLLTALKEALDGEDEGELENLVAQSNLLRSDFWRSRPTVARDSFGKRTYPDVVSMQQHPGRFWPCVDMCSVCGAQRNETGVACHCSNHRLHNMSKRLWRTCDVEFMDSVHSIATAMHNPELGDRVLDNIGLLLEPCENPHSDHHRLVMEETTKQHQQGKGVDVQDIVRGCSGDPDKAVQASNPCRWGSGMVVCVDLSEREDLVAEGVLRQKAVGRTEKAEIAGSVAIFSYRGWVSEDHGDLVLDSERAQLFLSLVSPQAREQRYMAAFLHDILFHPIFSVISDDVRASKMMVGMGGAPRQLLFILTSTIWVSTAPRELDLAIGCRTDNADVRFDPFSLRLLNPACGPAVRKALRDEWGESGLEAILDRMVGAVPLLLKRFRRIAMMEESRVLPDTTRQIAQAIHGRLYASDGKLMNPPSLMDPAPGRRPSTPMEETYAIKMAQLQFHLRILILDAIHEVRDAFAREMLGPAAFAAGMNAEQWTKGTVNGKRVLHAQPWALANAAVMRVMGRDTISSLKKQLNTESTGKHPLDFLPPVAFMWGANGTRSNSAFAGMARGGDFEYDETHMPVEPPFLHGLPIAQDDLRDHFKSVASLQAKDSSGQPVCRVLSRERELEQLPKSLQQFPFAYKLAVTAQVSTSSSKDMEQPWARTGQLIETRQGATFETLSGLFTANNDEGMGIDVVQVAENNPLLFRAALEVAKLPGWKELFKTDTASRDAIYADLRFSEAAKKRQPFWLATHHNRSHRGDRWLNPTQAEVNAVANQIQRTRKRLGLPPLPAAQAIPRRRAAGIAPPAARRRRRGAGQGAQEAEPSAAGDRPPAASSAASSAARNARAAARAAREEEPASADDEGSSAVVDMDDGGALEGQVSEEVAGPSAAQGVGGPAALPPARAESEVADPSVTQGVGGPEALPPHLDTTPSTAALGSESQLVEALGNKSATAGDLESDDELDVPLRALRPRCSAANSARDANAQGGGKSATDIDDELNHVPLTLVTPDSSATSAGGANAQDGSGGVGGGGEGGDGDEEDDSDGDEDRDERFVRLDVDENKWSLEYLYDVFQGLNFSGDVWMDSVIAFDKVGGLTAHVTRKPTARLQRYLDWIERTDDPKVSFTVYSNSGTLLYARRCDYGGVQLVRVIGLNEPCDGDWSTTMHIVRLFPTMHAIQHCEGDADIGANLGRRSLRAFWKTLDHTQEGDVYHQGDVDFKGDVRELIGVVRWYPYGQAKPDQTYFKECKSADLVRMGSHFRLKNVQKKQGKRSERGGGASGGGV